MSTYSKKFSGTLRAKNFDGIVTNCNKFLRKNKVRFLRGKKTL